MGDEPRLGVPGLGSDLVERDVFDLRVRTVRVDLLRFAIDPPLRLAGKAIPTREYVVLEVALSNGMTGTGYVLTRGQPIEEAARRLAAGLVGTRLENLFATRPADHGRDPLQRAQAVVDQCAWDLLGQAAGVPVTTLLGQVHDEQPVLLVAGYRRHGETDEAMAERLAGWHADGYRWLKIAADADPDDTAAVLRHLRRLAPADDLQVVVDVGFAGESTVRMAQAAREWEAYGLTWIEDPFPPASVESIAATRSHSPGLVAAGDEATPTELAHIVAAGAVDVLRADCTTTGGLTGLGRLAAASTLPVSCHVYPEIHRHLAFALTGTSPVESFPPRDPFDFVDRFIEPSDWNPRDGRVAAPAEPGLGITYRPDRLTSQLVRSRTYDQTPSQGAAR